MGTERVRTLRELIAELIDFVIEHPKQADNPVGFTLSRGSELDDGNGTIYYVREIRQDDAGYCLLTRGR
jgi:hypothetical protein